MVWAESWQPVAIPFTVEHPFRFTWRQSCLLGYFSVLQFEGSGQSEVVLGPLISLRPVYSLHDLDLILCARTLVYYWFLFFWLLPLGRRLFLVILSLGRGRRAHANWTYSSKSSLYVHIFDTLKLLPILKATLIRLENWCRWYVCLVML